MANVTASIVVSFGSSTDADGILDAVLDDLLNEDKTSFSTNETAFFLVYKSSNVSLIGKPAPSSGMVQGGSVVTRTIKEQLQFTTPDNEVSLSRIPYGSVTFKQWYGNSGTPTVDGRVVTLDAGYPAIVDVEYQAQGISYELIPPSGIDTTLTPEWPIVVVVSGEIV